MSFQQLRSGFIKQTRLLKMSAYRLSSSKAPHRDKVFGIGLSRTGTKSLHRAFALLGYRSDHFSTHLIEFDGRELSLRAEGLEAYDALTDITAALFFRELDALCPEAKFVLTVRDSPSWLSSCARHFPPLEPGKWPDGKRKVLALRRSVYGVESFDAKRFQEAYERHTNAVLDHFAEQRERLLVLDICSGQGWQPLCEFLDLAMPRVPFPWRNRQAKRG